MANTNISDSQIDNLVSLLDGYVQEGGHHLTSTCSPVKPYWTLRSIRKTIRS